MGGFTRSESILAQEQSVAVAISSEDMGKGSAPGEAPLELQGKRQRKKKAQV